ncbi:MAG: rod shape-determining protein RodA [Patescibacteria group bacterium]
MSGKKILSFDWILFLVILFLIIFGLVIQYSLSLNVPFNIANLFIRQLIFAIIGISFLFLVSSVDFRNLKPLIYFIYIITNLLLVAVLFFGETIRGAKGWFHYGFINFQPVELAKVAVILVLAYFWGLSKKKEVSIKTIFLSFLIIILPVALILKQPDLGSALVIIGLWLIFLLIVDNNIKHFIALSLIIVILFSVGWFVWLKDYQKTRLMIYLEPGRDPLGKGYQINQSIITVGSGKLFGRGLGFGPQSQLRFLPLSETDFVFATIGEETGFLGAGLVLIFFLVIIRRILKIAKKAYDQFGSLIAIGVSAYIFIQLIINVGMNIGLMPIIGIPLPFLSYGGSSLVSSLLAIGLVESIAIHQPRIEV